MTGRTNTRTWRPPAPPAPRVRDPATAALFRSLRRALAMGLETERGRQLAIAAIDRHVGPEDEARAPQE